MENRFSLTRIVCKHFNQFHPISAYLYISLSVSSSRTMAMLKYTIETNLVTCGLHQVFLCCTSNTFYERSFIRPIIYGYDKRKSMCAYVCCTLYPIKYVFNVMIREWVIYFEKSNSYEGIQKKSLTKKGYISSVHTQ